MFPNLDDVRNVGTYKVNYHWNLILNTVPAIVGGFPQSEQLNLRCFSATLPTASITPIPVSLRMHTIFQQGALNYNPTITLTFNDTIDETISNMLANWRELIFETRTGIQANKADVEAQVDLELLDRQSNRIRVYKMFGVWPTEYTLPDLESKEAEAIFRPSITFQYEFFVEETA